MSCDEIFSMKVSRPLMCATPFAASITPASTRSDETTMPKEAWAGSATYHNSSCTSMSLPPRTKAMMPALRRKPAISADGISSCA